MSVSSSRPFGGPSFPSSPAPTTASSLNYSSYGSTSFASPSRPPLPSASSSSYGASSSRPGQTRTASESLRPPDGGERRAESKGVARIHWLALRRFLASWLENEPPTARASAREKLTRLTKLQFQELSTDVYDELMRRLDAESGTSEVAPPFLPVREDFHPKRNQARQKLATLPKNRFKDLASDVFHELRRRFPEFDEEDTLNKGYDDPPPAPGPRQIGAPLYRENPSVTSIRESERSRANPTPPPMNRLASSSSSHRRTPSRNGNASGGSSVGSLHRSRPSRDLEILADRPGYGERGPPNPMAATNEVVVPNKSRLREEEIEVPYARDSQVMDFPQRNSSRHSLADRRDSMGSSVPSHAGLDRSRTPRDNRQDLMEMVSPGTQDEREYYDRMSFTSNLTNKSKQAGPTGWDDEREQKIRSDYELRIAGLERRLALAEGERAEAKRSEDLAEERRREWEDEVRGLKERTGTHAASLRSVQHEVDIARDATEAVRRQQEQSLQAAQEEIDEWRDRCSGMEDEMRRLEEERSDLQASAGSGGDEQAVSALKSELHSLVDELNALSMRNDELIAEREQDAEAMNEMEAKVVDYKRKYDAARIELRNLKATSTMFISKPISDDHLPASPDGNISDVNVSAFQTAIDGMLTAARSSAPSGVLPAMKAIVEAVTEIGEDVKQFEQKPNIDVDVSRLESLKHESTTRLSSLMQAARNHAMSSGLSPVSLIDGAAGHLSANVVEIIKLLKIRRTQSGQDHASRSSLSIKDMVNRGGEVKAANGNFDREYGGDERLRAPPVSVRKVSDVAVPAAPIRTATPITAAPHSSRLNGRSNAVSPVTQDNPSFRIQSFQSASSLGQKSDSFDLERKASVNSDRHAPRPVIDTRSASNGYGRERPERTSMGSEPTTSGSSAAGPATAYEPQNGYRTSQPKPEIEEEETDRQGSEQEWEDLKPYLNTQSSLLVNSIQNLLAAIRTGGHIGALNEHLSEVIAIASSIVAVSTNALPRALRSEGDGLLKDLVNSTNRLSEAQETATNGAAGAAFDKGVRQQIASASFGVAKSLKALMKLGTE